MKAINGQGREIQLPLKDGARFQVFEEREIELARVDRIRITRNGKSNDGRRLNNGNVSRSRSSAGMGIVLETGVMLDAKNGHLAFGYLPNLTLSAEQERARCAGRAKRRLLPCQSREQFYVSVSRGMQLIRIYTDDRQALQEAGGGASVRKSDVELAGFTAKENS